MTADDFRHWCERRGWTQAQTAAELGTTQATVSRWMNGERGIPGPVVKLMECLDEKEARST